MLTVRLGEVSIGNRNSDLKAIFMLDLHLMIFCETFRCLNNESTDFSKSYNCLSFLWHKGLCFTCRKLEKANTVNFILAFWFDHQGSLFENSMNEITKRPNREHICVRTSTSVCVPAAGCAHNEQPTAHRRSWWCAHVWAAALFPVPVIWWQSYIIISSSG